MASKGFWEGNFKSTMIMKKLGLNINSNYFLQDKLREEGEKSIENKFAFELNVLKSSIYTSCKTNSQFLLWVLSGYWIHDLQRRCLTRGKAISIAFTTQHLLKVWQGWEEL